MRWYFLYSGGGEDVAKGKYQEWLTDEGLLLIEGWARDGLTDEQIAHNMGITARTLYNWKTSYVPIFQALKEGKEIVDRKVENALLKRALGYKYTEQTVTNKGDVVNVEKYEHPNTTAIIYWLKNRKKKTWRDKHEDEKSNETKRRIIIVNNLKEMESKNDDKQ
jgi:hypothetical protein